MYGSTILNTKLSAVISILSGIGLLTVLSLTPVRSPKTKQRNIFESEEILPSKNFDKKPFVDNSMEKKENWFFAIKKMQETENDISKSIWGSGFNVYSPESIVPVFNENQFRFSQVSQSDVFSYYKDEKVTLGILGDSRIISNQILEYKYQNKMVDSSSIFQNRNMQPKNIEMSYQINSNFSANFKSSQFDIFDDRLKQYPTTMAGVSFTGSKYISSGFTAGESTLSNPYRYNQTNNLQSNNFYRENDISYRDVDRANKNLFEWQTNITPTKNLLFQTAVYNSNRSLINETNVSEGARLAMAVGLKYFVVNVKYNYLSDNLMRTILRPEAASAFNKDYAAFGFTIFLDSYKKYSIYIGNNFYNITTGNQPTSSNTSVPSNNSFSASFRGRSDYYNTIFFLNFKNNANREYYYSNFGVFRLPIYSQLNFEYATSIGLELSF